MVLTPRGPVRCRTGGARHQTTSPLPIGRENRRRFLRVVGEHRRIEQVGWNGGLRADDGPVAVDQHRLSEAAPVQSERGDADGEALKAQPVDE